MADNPQSITVEIAAPALSQTPQYSADTRQMVIELKQEIRDLVIRTEDKEMMRTRALAVERAVTMVLFTPLFLITLQFSAFILGRDFPIDGRLIPFCIAGISSVLLFGFPRKPIAWCIPFLKDKLKKSEEKSKPPEA